MGPKKARRAPQEKSAPSAARRGRGRLLGPAFGVLLLAAVLVFVVRFQPAPAHAARLILISIDTLRADHLGCYGYEAARTPNIDRLAEEGTLFENAATATPLTLPAHSSIFTGRTPLHHGIIDNFGFRLAASEVTLAEKLAARGMATGGFVGSFVLDSRWGIARGFRTYFDRFDAPSESATTLSSHQRPADQVLEPALRWMQEQGEAPFFAFVHFFDPHTPYAPPAGFREAFGDDDLGRYDGEIAFVDEQVGRLLSFLKDRRLYDDSLIVLLGDHGESLGEHGEAGHGLFVYDSTIRIPLLVKGPGVAAANRVPGQVRSIDVMPTILDLLSVEPPPGIDGVSLRALLEGRERGLDITGYVESHYARLHFGWAPLRGLRNESFKFIDAPKPELYDLGADPHERENLASEKAAAVAGLSGELERLRRGEASRAETAPVDPETEERLRSLGYITATAKSIPATEDRLLPDPKDKIGTFNRFTEATIANITGDFETASSLLGSFLEDDPDVMVAYITLGNIRLQRQDYLGAEEIFRRALARNDGGIEANYGLALAYKGQGKLPQAASGFERVLELDRNQVRAFYQLAEIRLAQRRPAEAERLLRERLSVESDSSLRLVLADALLSQGKRDEAWTALREAERDDDTNAVVQLNIGNLLLEDGKVDEAVVHYRRAQSLDSKDAQIANALGNALARRGEDAGALEAFRKATELDPEFAPAQNNLGIALARNGRPEEAERAFRRAIELAPDYAEAYNNLAFLYLQGGAASRAIPLLRRAVALSPDYRQARLNLEEALRRSSEKP